MDDSIKIAEDKLLLLQTEIERLNFMIEQSQEENTLLKHKLVDQ